jgi:hypothetical protein
MANLTIPSWKRMLGTLTALVVFVAAGLLFRLPNKAVAAIFGLAHRVVLAMGNESPASRALADIAFVFGRGGEGAEIFRRVITGARWEELEGIVGGAVVRSLP